MSDKITSSDQEFSSPDEMPPETRQLYDLAMRNAPALDKSASLGPVKLRVRTVVHTGLKLNGKTYGNLDEVPDEVRGKIEAAMKSPGAKTASSHVSFSLGPDSKTSVSGSATDPGAAPIEPRAGITMGFGVAVAVFAILLGLIWVFFRAG